MYSDIAALDRARNSQSLRKSPLGTAKLIWLLENFRQPTAKFLLRLSLKVLRSKTSMRLCRGGQRPLFSRHGSMGLTPLALAGYWFRTKSRFGCTQWVADAAITRFSTYQNLMILRCLSV